MSESYVTREGVAKHLEMSATHVSRLVQDEGLPAYPVNAGRRVHLRFRLSEVDAWLEERRERRLRDLLDGRRYTRRRIVPVETSR
jgi:excisionase family DNA binding protein